jgi:hypothetical protein
LSSFFALFAAIPIAPTESASQARQRSTVPTDFSRFKNGVLRSSRSPREAIYAEAAWIVLYNPIVLYHDVGGGCRG